MTSNSCTSLLKKTAILNIAFKIYSFKQYFLFLFFLITFSLVSWLLNKAEQILCYYKHPLEKIFGERCNIKAFPPSLLKISLCLPDSMSLAFQISFYFIVAAPTIRKKKRLLTSIDDRKTNKQKIHSTSIKKPLQPKWFLSKHFFHKHFSKSMIYFHRYSWENTYTTILCRILYYIKTRLKTTTYLSINVFRISLFSWKRQVRLLGKER